MCRALAQMSENTRAVVLLAGCHQLSYGEIVDRLKIPIGTVRSRLARGRRFLRAFMAGEHISSRNVHTDPRIRPIAASAIEWIGSIRNAIPAQDMSKHRSTERPQTRGFTSLAQNGDVGRRGGGNGFGDRAAAGILHTSP